MNRKLITRLLAISLAGAFYVKNVNAQTNIFPPNGNVGIGTVTPASKLEILPVNGNALTIRPYGAAANNTGQLQFRELAANGTNYVGFRAPDALAATLIFRLPTVYGSSGQVLSTTGSGVLTWSNAGATRTLNNLQATSVNMGLLPALTNTIDLGSASRAWRNIYTTGIYPRTGSNLGFGAVPGISRATFVNQTITTIASAAALQIGATSTDNLIFDNNEVQARSNGATSTLWLNNRGGNIICGGIATADYMEVVPNIYMDKNASVYGRLGVKTTTPGYDLDIISTEYTAASIVTPYVDGTTLVVKANATSGNSWALYAEAPFTGYAAFFSGHVYCTGNYLPSDENLKENVQPMEHALEKIMKLEVKTYNFKQDYKGMHLPEMKQHGFMAQNIETVFPELVKESADKSIDKDQPVAFKAVNYLGIIPVLAAAIQEQNNSTDELKKQNELLRTANKELKDRMERIEKALQSCCVDYTPDKKSTDRSPMNTEGRLEQNTPNPFNSSTVINYKLPASASAAFITVFNMSGELIKTYNVVNATQLTIEAGELAAGNYSYHLMVDGKSIDSKMMTLTK